MTLSTMDIPFSPEMGGKECLSALGCSRTHRHEAFERWQHEDGESVIVFTPDGLTSSRWLACAHYNDGVEHPLPLTKAELAACILRIKELEAGDAE